MAKARKTQFYTAEVMASSTAEPVEPVPIKENEVAPINRINGANRQERLMILLTETQPWEFVKEDFSAEGIRSDTNMTLKNYVVIRNATSGVQLIVGRGEATKYAGVTIPRKTRSTPTVQETFADGFDNPTAPDPFALNSFVDTMEPVEEATPVSTTAFEFLD